MSWNAIRRHSHESEQGMPGQISPERPLGLGIKASGQIGNDVTNNIESNGNASEFDYGNAQTDPNQ